MNVCVMDHYMAPPPFGPNQRHTRFARHFVAEGWSCTVVHASYMHRPARPVPWHHGAVTSHHEDGVRFVSLATPAYRGNGPMRVLNMLEFARKAAALLPRVLTRGGDRPDVIVASSAHPFTCVAGILIARRLGIPCVAEIRDLWPLSLVSLGHAADRALWIRAMYRLERWIYEAADAIVFSMDGGSDYVSDRGWSQTVQREKIHHVPNTVDLAAFDNAAATHHFADAVLDDPGRGAVVYAGSLGPANAAHFLLEAAAILAASGQPYDFVVYGDGIEMKRLDAFARHHGLRHVHLRGRVDGRFIPGILKRGAANVMTLGDAPVYKYGTSLNKFAEYLASGRPIVTNVPSRTDVVGRLEAGVAVAPASAQALAEGIATVMGQSSDDRDAMGARARRAAAELDTPVVARRYMGLLEAVVSTFPRHGSRRPHPQSTERRRTA